jgi:recombination DNA repair RAD52 pathway protein
MDIRGQFTTEQVKHLLNAIKPTRVLRDGKGHSHVSQQDITAHLIRMFGFGNFDIEVASVDCLFETSEVKTNRAGKEYVAWDVAYRALVRLTVRNSAGQTVAHYENGSVGSAQNQPSRADAHDLAYKSAISLSIKRAAIALGDQFGLSLYNKGQTDALVIRTLVGTEPVEDIQADIPQQVALGNDEVDREDPDATTVTPASADKPEELTEDVMGLIAKAPTEEHLMKIYNAITARRAMSEVERKALSARKSELKDGN